ncbi:glycoside hydrolase family 25 protein [Lentzea albida]|uniref:Lyzozyme M1 (1,4-beta-N-acetylmuramidase), GH25 family n=1 Tax=Lentzea albida TaxID=65499 RepID=A0A1H9VGL6_9PSEU|nr:glycoside hydrolase family 25 protein [Lentzea albida]SES20792.1 Lyzozyme M1 (1,4-beta-N-acetylmuramidase), GH25 family [Lentzea albida]
MAVLDVVRGVDVSRFQKLIDWLKLPKNRDFAYLGMWDWKNAVVDGFLARNIAEADKAGKTIGGYYRVDPTRWTAEQEARRMVDLLRQYGLDQPGRLIPCADIELTNTPGDNAVNWPEWTRAFFAAWRSLTAMPLIIYSSGSWFRSLLGGTADWPPWVRCWVGHTAKYSDPPGLPDEEWAGKTPHESDRAVMHQYSHTGRLPGVEGDVDLDALMPGVRLADITLQAQGGNMVWLPKAKRVNLGANVAGGPYDDVRKPKVCWHFTQGSSLAGARAAFAAYPPHIGYDPKTRELEQYVPLDRHSYAFFNGEADDEYIIQIEVVGFSEQAHLMSDEHVQNIVDDLVDPLEELIGVPPVVIRHGFRGAGEGIVLASPSSPIRISLEELREFSGHLGHQHIPGDGHWDPGKFRIDEVLKRSQGEDDMSWDTPIPKLPSEADPRTEAPAGEMLKWTNVAAWKSADLVEAVNTKLDALLGREAGDIDEVELAKQLLAQGLGSQLGRIDEQQFAQLVKAVNDEADRREKYRVSAPVPEKPVGL